MLPRRFAAARPLLRAALPSSSRVNLAQIRRVSQADIDDPDMVLPPHILSNSMIGLKYSAIER
jgi:hypothetical protein